MGSIRGDEGAKDENGGVGEYAEVGGIDAAPPAALTGEAWPYGGGEGAWQTTTTGVKERMGYLRQSREMSDILLLACDENWWFGNTVKDFSVSAVL
jgi:hypothetical protein